MSHTSQALTFEGSSGGILSAKLDLPAGPIRATALFAHCFTCSKDIFAARRVASDLARRGIAVLRFDFAGLGGSEGDFADTTFSADVEDLVRAADALEKRIGAPSILVGHSLGGAAVLCAAPRLPNIKAVVTIGAPADANHVVRNFAADLPRIEAEGEGEVRLAGRPFRIKKRFLEDIGDQGLLDHVAGLTAALLILHAPRDDVVGIDNASRIFTAAKHPKSFVSLDTADHLLSRHEDAAYVAEIISAWASRFIDREDEADEEHAGVHVAETGEGRFQNVVKAGRYRLFADEPEEAGGLGSGPDPYAFLSIALAACTSMTLRLYAEHKKLDIGRIEVGVNHGKVYAKDCEDCADDVRARNGKIDRFERTIKVGPPADRSLDDKLLEIADKCPVHRTLTEGAAVVTKFADR